MSELKLHQILAQHELGLFEEAEEAERELLDLATHKIRDAQQERDGDIAVMLREDAKRYRKLAKILAKVVIALQDASEAVEVMDTAARDEIPEIAWPFCSLE
jgi:hypothetical protein